MAVGKQKKRILERTGDIPFPWFYYNSKTVEKLFVLLNVSMMDMEIFLSNLPSTTMLMVNKYVFVNHLFIFINEMYVCL